MLIYILTILLYTLQYNNMNPQIIVSPPGALPPPNPPALPVVRPPANRAIRRVLSPLGNSIQVGSHQFYNYIKQGYQISNGRLTNDNTNITEKYTINPETGRYIQVRGYSHRNLINNRGFIYNPGNNYYSTKSQHRTVINDSPKTDELLTALRQENETRSFRSIVEAPQNDPNAPRYIKYYDLEKQTWITLNLSDDTRTARSQMINVNSTISKQYTSYIDDIQQYLTFESIIIDDYGATVIEEEYDDDNVQDAFYGDAELLPPIRRMKNIFRFFFVVDEVEDIPVDIGSFNTDNCLIECIKDHLKNPKDIDILTSILMNDEATTELMEDIRKLVNAHIILRTPLGIHSKYNKDSLPTLNLYYNNHHLTQIPEHKPIIEFVDNLPTDIDPSFITDYDPTYTLTTYSTQYILKNQTLHDTILTESEEPIKIHIIKQVKDALNSAGISPYKGGGEIINAVNRGIYYNNSDVNAGFSIDVINAYGQYSGPLPKDCDTYVEINQIQSHHQGFVKVEYELLGQDIEDLISMPYYRWMVANNVEHTAHYAIVAEPTNFTIPTTRKVWTRYVQGSLSKHNKQVIKQQFITTDRAMVPGFDYEQYNYNSHKLYKCFKKEEKTSSTSYPHIVLYYQSHVKQLIHQLLLNNPTANINRIWVDSVQTESELIYDSTIWAVKTPTVSEDNTNYVGPWLPHHNRVPSSTYFKPMTLITGKAGTGKSHIVKSYINSCINPIIISGQNVHKRQYTDMIHYTIDMFLSKYGHFAKYNKSLPYTHAIMDEWFMIDIKQAIKLCKLLRALHIKPIFVGDPNQITCVNGTPISLNQFKDIHELTFNYRQKDDPEFVKMLDHLLQTGEFNYSQSLKEEELTSDDVILVSKINIMDRINKIVYAKNESVEQYGYKHNTPYRIMKAVKHIMDAGLYVGDLVHLTNISRTTLTFTGPEDIIYTIKHNQFKDEIYRMGYAWTYHSVQGMTIPNKRIVLSEEGLFQRNRMLYVGLTRATHSNQIYKLKETKE